MNIKFNKEQIEYIVNKYCNQKASLFALSKEFNVHPRRIRKTLVENNIIIRDLKKLKTVNENYFSIIDTEDKAYFLGLLFADGCVVDTTPWQKVLTISLQAQDKHILESMKNYLNFNGNIRLKKRHQPHHLDQYVLSITSNKLCDDLIKLGCTPRKSKTAIYPEINEKLIKHFVRGLFDGDGSISTFPNRNGKTKSFRFDVSGTLSICSGIKQAFINQVGLNDRKIIDRKNVYVFAVSGNKNIRKIYDYLYRDANIFLTRKKEKMSQA